MAASSSASAVSSYSSAPAPDSTLLRVLQSVLDAEPHLFSPTELALLRTAAGLDPISAIHLSRLLSRKTHTFQWTRLIQKEEQYQQRLLARGPSPLDSTSPTTSLPLNRIAKHPETEPYQALLQTTPPLLVRVTPNLSQLLAHLNANQSKQFLIQKMRQKVGNTKHSQRCEKIQKWTQQTTTLLTGTLGVLLPSLSLSLFLPTLERRLPLTKDSIRQEKLKMFSPSFRHTGISNLQHTTAYFEKLVGPLVTLQDNVKDVLTRACIVYFRPADLQIHPLQISLIARIQDWVYPPYKVYRDPHHFRDRNQPNATSARPGGRTAGTAVLGYLPGATRGVH